MEPLPSHLSASDTGSALFLAIGLVFCVGCLAWSWANRSRVGWLPLILMAGGLVASLQESLIDRMILLWYPDDAPNIVYEALGFNQPLYMIVIYAGFVGMGTYFTYEALKRDPGDVWK